MPSYYADIVMNQGETFVVNVTVNNLNNTAYDLTGSSFASQMKNSYYSTDKIDVHCGLKANSNNIINLTLSAQETSNINPGVYVYDVNATNTSNTVIRLLEGTITVTPRVTI